MRCSVVIPTIDRQNILPRLIDALSQQTEPAEQIILVDQSESKDVALAARTDITYVRLPEPNTPRARNAGVQAATGDIILFLDDDVELPDRTLMARVRNFFQTHQDYAGFALRIEDKNAKLNRENQAWRARVMQVTRTGRVKPEANGPAQDVSAPRGGGVAYRRSAIISVGGFDERYTGNAMREETDFSLRVVKHQGPIRYEPDCKVIHLALMRGGSRRMPREQWYFDFFANEMLFQLTHFPAWTLLPFFVRKARPILACWLWYGKGKVSWMVIPLKGFYEGIRRNRKGFTPFPFASR